MLGDDDLVMCVERKNLFGKNDEDSFAGFRLADNTDYSSRIISNAKYGRHSIIEMDPFLKQIITSSVLVNQKDRRVYFYSEEIERKFASHSNTKYSGVLAIDSHVYDCASARSENPLLDNVISQLEKQVAIRGKITGAELFGYTNHDNNYVSRVHFGLTYFIYTDAKEAVPLGNNRISGDMIPIEELLDMFLSRDILGQKTAISGRSELALLALKKSLGF